MKKLILPLAIFAIGLIYLWSLNDNGQSKITISKQKAFNYLQSKVDSIKVITRTLSDEYRHTHKDTIQTQLMYYRGYRDAINDLQRKVNE